MTQLGSKDSSRNLHANCAISFLFCSHLILHALSKHLMWLFAKKNLLDKINQFPVYFLGLLLSTACDGRTSEETGCNFFFSNQKGWNLAWCFWSYFNLFLVNLLLEFSVQYNTRVVLGTVTTYYQNLSEFSVLFSSMS